MGMVKGEAYRNHISAVNLHFSADDVLVLYTDGIVEAMHPETGAEYGYERLRLLIERKAMSSTEQIKSAVLDDVNTFLEKGEIKDDLTLLIIKFK